MLKQLLFSAAVATIAISASAESKVLWQSEEPEGDPISGWNTFYEMTADEAAIFNAGDVVYMTITAKGAEGWPQVAIFEGGVGWPPMANAGAGDAFPKKATMTLSPDNIEAIHANGISFRGESVYVSEIGYETASFEISPYAVWIGPKECGWGDPASVAKEVFADVKAGDQIVVEYDTKFEGMNVNLKFNGWGACSINLGAVDAGAVDFITNDKENGTITITLPKDADNFNWADGDNEAQDWNLFELLKENGFMVQGPSILNQILYIPAPLEFPEEMSFTLNGETELEGVTVSQEFGDGTIDIYVNGESSADEITMEFATPQGWDSMVVQVLGGGDFEYAKKAPVENDEYSWVSLEQAEAYGSKPGNTFTFPVNGEEYYGIINLVKDNQVYWATISVNFEVSKAEEAEPTFPNTVEYTINGEKELPGVNVEFKEDKGYGPTMILTGESDAETISLSLALPDGWDGWVVSSSNEVSEQPIAQTRGEDDWYPLDFLINYMNYKKGNTVTFTVGEEDQWASFGLYKDGQVYNLKNISIEFEVAAGGGDESEPLIPKSIGITTYAEGLDVVQEKDEEDGSINIDLTGAISEEEYELVLDVPQGWEGYIILPFSNNITVGNSDNSVVPGPRKISASDHDWAPIEEAFEEGYVKGNKITFKATGNWEFAYAYLYKGDMYDKNAFIGITAKVCSLTANQAAYDKVVAEIDAVKAEYEKAVSDIETQYPEYDMSEMKGYIENSISEAETGAKQALETANEDGEEFFFPFSAEDIENMIAELKENAKTSGVNGVNAADKAAYYDLQGNKISTPKAGMFVKVVDGKATKVVVK